MSVLLIEWLNFLSECATAFFRWGRSFCLIRCGVPPFTRIPVPLALEVTRQHLEADDTLADRSSLAAEDALQLLSLCLNATYFSFRGTFYHKIFGTAMGSPVSVVAANLVMEHVQELALSSFPPVVRFSKCYIDDVCCSLPKNKVPTFLQHLNTIHSIYMWDGEWQSPSFPRCTFGPKQKQVRFPQGFIISQHIPVNTLMSPFTIVARTLKSRTVALSSSPDAVNEELSNVVKVLTVNGYPRFLN